MCEKPSFLETCALTLQILRAILDFDKRAAIRRERTRGSVRLVVRGTVKNWRVIRKMKNHKLKKYISLILAFAMLFSLPSFADAEETAAAPAASDATVASADGDAAAPAIAEDTPETEETPVQPSVEADPNEAVTDLQAQLYANKGNEYPIVLVHGLFGWGNTEVAHLNYWGGTDSLQKMLNRAGYTVYTPTIGPVASNWDRACELYAYLVGGTVDYGAAHSAKNGHARYGRSFPGVLPQLNDPDSTLKIHLVGHSMGGETIRMLAQILENGDPDEITATTDGSISPLFAGTSRHWIESITTLCTPHDGSQYDTKKEKIEPLVHQFVGALAAATGANINEENLGLDFKLDQWGLERQPGENYESYFTRVMSSNIWTKHITDLSIYDLDTDGAAVLNDYAKAQSDIYYFSVACSDTYASPIFPHYHKPYPNMNPMMVKSSTYMGKFVNYAYGHINITPDWWENDGIVSVHSAIYPDSVFTTVPDAVNKSYGTAADGTMVFKDGTQKGVWNYIEKIPYTDHINMVGQKQNKAKLQGKFYELAAMLGSIPA
jgi:triacylglycerol lipase